VTATVLLIRHASHGLLGRILCGRSEGVQLSEAGRAEAATLADRLARGPTLAAIYASPQRRTRETAEYLAEACRAPLSAEERLDEVDFGEWTGMAFEALAPDPRWRRWNEDRGRARAPGGESLLDVQARMAGFLTFVAEQHAGAVIAAVSHADVIKATLAYALGLPLHFYDRFEVAPASISAVVVGGWGLKVLSVNETMR
jgi:broad specificity phosphatase PhoE